MNLILISLFVLLISRRLIYLFVPVVNSDCQIFCCGSQLMLKYFLLTHCARILMSWHCRGSFTSIIPENAVLAKPVNKSMLKQRIITALILAPLFILAVIYGQKYGFAALVLAITAAAIFEWLRI